LILEHPEKSLLVVPIHKGRDLPMGLFRRILKDAGFSIEELPEVLIDVTTA
jgi:predicted RNA binding protein YcfA (HicA-like mRNA interferase family)